MESQSPPMDASASRGSDKIWAILCHVSSLMGVGIILPLIVYLAMKGESDFVMSNAREALNFHLSLLIYCICCIPLVFILIGIPMLIILGLGSIVLGIIAALKASNWDSYRYPLTIRLVK